MVTSSTISLLAPTQLMAMGKTIDPLGLLGANGAGRPPPLRLCAGFLQPDAGAIRVAGIDRCADPEAAARRVGVCTQDDTFDSDFTVRGHLEPMSRYFRPRPPALPARVAALLERFGLDRYADAQPTCSPAATGGG